MIQMTLNPEADGRFYVYGLEATGHMLSLNNKKTIRSSTVFTTAALAQAREEKFRAMVIDPTWITALDPNKLEIKTVKYEIIE